MSSLMSQFDEAIAALMPPAAAEDYRKQCRERAARECRLTEQLRNESIEAIERIASGIRHPRIARSDLEAAQKHLERAISVAAALDPE